jgi:hypothetical protein
MGARRKLQSPFPPAQSWTEGWRVEAASLRKEPQCRCTIKAERKSQSHPINLKSRRPVSRERCRTSHRRRPKLPTCPSIPTASQHNPRLTSRVAPSSQDRRKAWVKPCRREHRGPASQRTSVRPEREPPSGGFSLLTVPLSRTLTRRRRSAARADAVAPPVSLLARGAPHREAPPRTRS